MIATLKEFIAQNMLDTRTTDLEILRSHLRGEAFIK